MGGLGSGRREYATTPTVGECHTIDVNNLTDLVTHPGGVARYPWHDEYGHGEQVAEIGIGVERDGEPRFTPAVDGVERADVADALGDRATHLRLRYTAAPESDDPREYDYRVELTYTACPFGGVRPWFLCPADGCGERGGKLYRPRGREVFACRECYELAYRTSRVSHDDVEQAELRYRRAFAKADAKDRRPHPNNGPWFPEKPTGMHGETYAELCANVHAAKEEWAEAMDAKMQAFIERSRALVDEFG